MLKPIIRFTLHKQDKKLGQHKWHEAVKLFRIAIQSLVDGETINFVVTRHDKREGSDPSGSGD